MPLLKTKLAALLLAALLAPLAPARADESTEQAKEHFKKGQTHYALGEFDQAADEFKEAFRLREVPIILFNIAQAMRLSGHLQQAVFYYSQYLARQPDAANRAEVEARVTDLRERLKLDPPPGSEPPKVEASAPPVKSQPKKPRAAAPPAAVKAPPAPQDSPSTKPARLAGYVALGTGVLLEGGAFLFHSSASSAADELSKKYQAGTLTQADAHLKSDVDSKGKLATVTFIGGLVLLASGATLVFAF